MPPETNTKIRKSLALDVHTYNLLQEICNRERRSKIDQLKVLIEREHRMLIQEPHQAL
jgi:transcriptional regulator of NAD metabolism|tara:strand:+ start:1411 stop:1584 length:174 start_codon:yes stop_codon:yes gene_type:complete